MYSSVCLTFFSLCIFRPLFQPWFIWIRHISAPQPIFPYSTWSCLLYNISTPALQNLAMWKPFTCISYSRVSSVWTPHDLQMAACDFFSRSHCQLPVYGHFSSFHCVLVKFTDAHHIQTTSKSGVPIWKCGFMYVLYKIQLSTNLSIYVSRPMAMDL